MSVTRQLDPIDFHSIFFSYNGSQWGPSTVWNEQIRAASSESNLSWSLRPLLD